MNLRLLVGALLFSSITIAADFDEDKTFFYVAEQGPNESLQTVNGIICMMMNTRPEAFVNDGVYIALVYEDECNSVSQNSSDEQSMATPQPSSSNGSSQNGINPEEKNVVTMTLDVTRVNESSPVKSKVWVEFNMENDGHSFEELIYVTVNQTAGVSEQNPNGAWSMNFTMTAAEDMTLHGNQQITEGSQIGMGYINASGNSVRFREFHPMGEDNIVANYLSGGNIEGVFSEHAGFYDEENEKPKDIYALYKYSIDTTSKIFCKTLLNAYEFNFSNSTSDGRPSKTLYTPVEGDGITVDEVCYSTASEDALKHVWRYGVYELNGKRVEIENPAFPIWATVTRNGIEQEIHGYASYWGVHLDDNSRSLADENTIFYKDSRRRELQENQDSFTIKQNALQLEKRLKSYVSLDNLDGHSISWWVSDEYWKNELTSLDSFLTEGTYKEFSGNFDSETQTFTFTHGIKFDPNWEKIALPTPISFTTSDWQSKMQKTWDAGTDYEHTEKRSLHVCSHDTRQCYNIRDKSMNNPADASSLNGILTETSSLISNDTAAIADGLYCIMECPTAELLTATYADALLKGEAAKLINGIITEPSPSPYLDIGPYISQDITVSRGSGENTYNESFTKGQWYDGIRASEVVKYTISDSIVYGPSGAELKVNVNLNSIIELGDSFQGASFLRQYDNYSQEMSWGISSGILVSAEDLSKLECDKDANGNYIDDHPELSGDAENETRYCANKLWSDDNVLTTYQMRFLTEPNYSLVDSSNQIVTFDQPKILYYDVPNENSFGADAGKRIRLEFSGFGDLYGIPGYVYDTLTGENLGDYFADHWGSNLRYISRFTIPEGAEIEDPTTSVRYKIKPLEGEEILPLKNSAVGTLVYGGAEVDLVSENSMTDVGPDGGDNYIGPKPTTNIINNGEPSVIHGEIIFDPSPTEE